MLIRSKKYNHIDDNEDDKMVCEDIKDNVCSHIGHIRHLAMDCRSKVCSDIIQVCNELLQICDTKLPCEQLLPDICKGLRNIGVLLQGIGDDYPYPYIREILDNAKENCEEYQPR